MPIEDIGHLGGHRPSGRPRQHQDTEKVYRKELRPVLTKGARTMDAIFWDDAQ